MSKPIISVVTVNYFSADLVDKLSKTLPKDGTYEFIVVDNSNNPKELSKLKAIKSINRIIDPQKNLGFGAANNLAANDSGSELLLFLNPDTQIKEIDLGKIIKRFSSESSLAMLGPMILYDNSNLQRSAHCKYPYWWSHALDYSPILRLVCGKLGFNQYPTLFSDKMHANRIDGVKSLLGACIFVRRSVFNELDGFDEKFFLYREETDLAQRINSGKHNIVYDPEFVVFHTSGGASKNSTYAEFNPYYIKSSYQYMSKWHSKIYVVFCWLLGVIGSFTSLISFVLIGLVKKKHLKVAKQCWQGFVLHLKKPFGIGWYYK